MTKRRPATPSSFDRFCRESFALLERARTDYLVIGGLAVIALGEPRTTGDVDVVAFAPESDAERILAEAARAKWVFDPDAERERLASTGTLRLRKPPYQLDIIFASLPFERVARERSSSRRLFGRSVPFPTPEDLLIFKILAGRDKDIVDAVGVAKRHGQQLDVAFVRRAIEDVCDLAEDLAAYRRLEEVLRKAGLRGS